MKKKMLRRIPLNRETIRQLDPTILDAAVAGNTTTACSNTFLRPTLELCNRPGGTGPKQL